MREIALRNCDDVALVSDEDFDFLNGIGWFKNRGGYAQATRETHPNDSTKQKPMHIIVAERFLGEIAQGVQVDHANCDKLDNRRENLRLCTPLQNAVNKSKPRCKIGASRYKGVSKAQSVFYPWRAQIAVNGKNRHLGVFKTEEEAARAYNNAAKELFGEFAHLNKVGEREAGISDPQKQHKTFKAVRKSTNKYRGITKSRKRWTANICYDGNSHYLGIYDTPEEAALAWDREAFRLFGTDAPLNFPGEVT